MDAPSVVPAAASVRLGVCVIGSTCALRHLCQRQHLCVCLGSSHWMGAAVLCCPALIHVKRPSFSCGSKLQGICALPGDMSGHQTRFPSSLTNALPPPPWCHQPVCLPPPPPKNTNRRVPSRRYTTRPVCRQHWQQQATARPAACSCCSRRRGRRPSATWQQRPTSTAATPCILRQQQVRALLGEGYGVCVCGLQK